MSCVSREKQDASSVESGSTQESPSRNLEGLQASRRAEWKTGKQAEPARHRPAPAPASPKHALARSSHRRQGQGLMWCCGKPRNLNGARKRFYVFHVFPAWRAPTRFSAGPNQHLCVTAPIKCRDFPIGRRCDGPGQSQRGPSRRVFQPMVAAGQSVPGRPATAKKEKKKKKQIGQNWLVALVAGSLNTKAKGTTTLSVQALGGPRQRDAGLAPFHLVVTLPTWYLTLQCLPSSHPT